MATKNHTSKLVRNIFDKVQKMSPIPSNIQKEGVTVIEGKNKVYVYAIKRKK